MAMLGATTLAITPTKATTTINSITVIPRRYRIHLIETRSHSRRRSPATARAPPTRRQEREGRSWPARRVPPVVRVCAHIAARTDRRLFGGTHSIHPSLRRGRPVATAAWETEPPREGRWIDAFRREPGYALATARRARLDRRARRQSCQWRPVRACRPRATRS